jgi:hypothetical protein
MESAARSYCAGRLSASGYSVSQQAFTFSSRPARVTPPITGMFAALAAFLASHLAIAHDSHLLGLAVLALAWGVAVLEFRRVLGRRATQEGSDERSVNLVATRGTPGVWLVAHIDSKSQTIPMLLRIAAVVGVITGMVALALTFIVGAVASLAGRPEFAWALDPVVMVLTVIVVISSIPLGVCWIRNHSRGALDNASGVAAVLLAAEATSREGVGVLITSAEELGLAGARAFAAGQPASVAVNCDTIDDGGRFIAMRSRRSRGNKSVNALLNASTGLRIELRARRTLPGVVTDGTALAQAGWDVATLSRGNLSTLGRVHTSRDTADRIAGTGIANAARLLTATIEELA